MVKVERSHERVQAWELRLDGPLLAIALLFTAALLQPVVPGLPSWTGTVATIVNVVSWIVFAIDYGVRLMLSPDRWSFVRHHPIDLAIVALPLLRPLRLLRILRLLRVGALLGAANRRAQRTLHGRVVSYVVSVTMVAIVLASVGIWTVERQAPNSNIKSLSDGLWWSATTLATVGYGDRYPVTGQGTLIAVGLMLTGVALLGVITASIAAWFVERLSVVEDAELEAGVTLQHVLDELYELRAEVRRLSEARVDVEG